MYYLIGLMAVRSFLPVTPTPSLTPSLSPSLTPSLTPNPNPNSNLEINNINQLSIIGFDNILEI